MKETILLMIKQAEEEENYSLINYVRSLIEEFAETINCPSNWRSIGSELAQMYDSSDWVYGELELWNYVE